MGIRERYFAIQGIPARYKGPIQRPLEARFPMGLLETRDCLLSSYGRVPLKLSIPLLRSRYVDSESINT
jgi:hypothetical protein